MWKILTLDNAFWTCTQPSVHYIPFLQEFAEWVSHLLNKYMDPLILGDLNVNLKQPDLPNSAAFLECLDSYALKQWVLDPTHQKWKPIGPYYSQRKFHTTP